MAERCCPSCGAPFKRKKPWGLTADQTVIPPDVRERRPGDVTICTDCGKLAWITEGDGLRAFTDAEEAAASTVPRVILMRRTFAKIHAAKN